MKHDFLNVLLFLIFILTINSIFLNTQKKVNNTKVGKSIFLSRHTLQISKSIKS